MRPWTRTLCRAAAVATLALAAAAGTAAAHHGADDGHLVATSKNMQLVSELEPTSQGAIAPGQIGDLAVLKGFAYLQSGGNCAAGDGGFYTIDIRNPAAPSAVGFTDALPGSFHGEAHAIAVDTPAFRGDLLAVDNHPCGTATTGGLDLYDISNPASPVALRRGFGDGAPADEVSSLALWDAGSKAYAAALDIEDNMTLDIFDVSDPSAPVLVRDYDVVSEFPQAATDSANAGDLALFGQVTVKQIGGHFKLLLAYNDSGYIQFDAQDPSHLQYDGDSDFQGTDPLTGFNPPEGNANHAEHSFDGRFLVTAEWDRKPFRVEQLLIEGAGTRPAEIVPGGAAPNYLPDNVMNGPAAYVGYACNGSQAVPTPAAAGMPDKLAGEEWIAVAQRGPGLGQDPDDTYPACFPGEKAANALAKGWDAVVIANRHNGSEPADGVECGSGAFQDSQHVAICTSHEALHQLFNDPAEYGAPYDDDAELVPVGTPAAHKVRVEGDFDGWGYVSLYDASPDGSHKFPLVDAAAVREALNPAYALGFGDLSAGEQALDPTEPLAYTAYHSAGVRVFSFESGRLTEQGAFVDSGGSNVAGIEQFTTSSGERLIAASDRDFGLYILRYTGPLGARPPSCSGTSVAIPAGGSLTVPLTCSDPNANPITRRIVSGPAAGSLGAIDQAAGTVTYTHTGAPGTDSFTFAASDGAASSSSATATISVAGAACCTPPPNAFELQQLTLRPARFRAYPSGSPVRSAAARRGTRVTYRVSKAARATFTISRVRRGRKPLPLKGSFRHTGASGANTFTFTGRLRGRKLAPGAYRLSVRATDAAGVRSKALSVPFRIVR